MCLLVFSYKQHPEYNLILAANRDEEYKRPTRPAQFWSEHSHILAGKDEKAGGTWLGVTKTGTFAALTNYRDPTINKKDAPSRGHLVLDYLKNNGNPADYLQQVHLKAPRYSGFNLLAGMGGALAYYSNQQQEIKPLQAGLYGLSNHLLDTPWPKVTAAKQGLHQLLKEDTFTIDNLFKLLADERQADEEQLPSTGLSKELEKKVSPIFIKSEGYGTRNSTVLLIKKDGEVTFEERRYKSGTLEVDDVNRYEFYINN